MYNSGKRCSVQKVLDLTNYLVQIKDNIKCKQTHSVLDIILLFVFFNHLERCVIIFSFLKAKKILCRTNHHVFLNIDFYVFH